jgi:microcystin-dependent protein
VPYIINFTDKNNKSPITVFDNTSNTDTSLVFPGRNQTGYGQIIAENFLRLLENFSGSSEPLNPVEGQLWFDTQENILKIFDNVSWRSASNIQKSPIEPDVEKANVGELWVDTTNQQLRIYTGNRWILVGPSESSIDGLRYGPAVETIFDSDNNPKTILILYIADIPIAIVSKDTFTPKIIIEGYDAIRTGINLTSLNVGSTIAKFFGTATSADSLNIAGVTVPAGRFLRSDIVNTVDNSFNIRGQGGLTLGVDNTFNLSTTQTSAKIYNSISGSSIDIQTNRNGIPNTVLRVIENRVGINKAVPDESLDVDGNIKLSGSLIVDNSSESTNLNNGSIRTAGGISVSKNLLVGTNLTVDGITQTTNIQPKISNTFDLGTDASRWNTIRAKKILADEIEGVLIGNINGNANSATNLKNVTTFQLSGDVVSAAIQFDGQVGSYTKIFNTSLTANIISNKPTPFPIRSDKSDTVLVYRPSLALPTGATEFRIISIDPDFTCNTDIPHGLFVGDILTTSVSQRGFTVGFSYFVTSVATSTKFTVSVAAGGATLPLQAGSGFSIPAIKGSLSAGLIKQTRDVFIGDLGVPIGAIFPFAGSVAPQGYLLCDGSEVERSKFPDLFDVIGNTYGVAVRGFETFVLPDLRGRFPLGRDNMDNNNTVGTQAGTQVDAGGGNIDRVPDVNADILGGSAGQSSVALQLGNLPDHSHSLRVNDIQYAAVKIDTSVNAPALPGLGPTAPGQAQYIEDSGGIKKPAPDFVLQQPVGIMNPYLVLNYIIRSGPASRGFN